jgi:DNA-binding CsgD family transcriptional regulator
MTRQRRYPDAAAPSLAALTGPAISKPDTWARELLALYSVRTLARFIEEAFHALRRAVVCDYVSVVYKRAGEGFLKERDSRGRVWSRAFMRRYVELTPAIPLVVGNPGIKVLATRFALPASDEELQRTAFFREIMQRQGWRHGAVLCFWGEPLGSFPICVFTLYRTQGQPDFSDKELALLEHLHAFLAPAVTRFHLVSASAAISDGMALALRRLSHAVIVLDWQMRIVHTSVGARRCCAEWNRIGSQRPAAGVRDGRSLPDCLLLACRELREELSAVLHQDGDCPTQRRRWIVNPSAPRLQASVTIICQAAGIAEPSFVIEFDVPSDESMQDDRSAATVLTRLTPSEREVARVISQGLSNEEAAERLGKTVHAVKFLLHRIYGKLDVENRVKLSLLLAGSAGSSAR